MNNATDEELKKAKKREYDRLRRQEKGDEIRQKDRERYQRDREKKRAANKRYRIDNKEQLAEKKRQDYIANRDARVATIRRYAERNRERLLKYWKNYYYEHKAERTAKFSAWTKENRQKVNVYKNRYKARKRSLESRFSPQQWDECKQYFDNKCAYCGQQGELTQEHFIPVTAGGEYTVNNIIPACTRCNCSKNNSDALMWYTKQSFCSEQRLNKILKYLRYNGQSQQLSIL